MSLETVFRHFNGVSWGTSPRVIARKADGSSYLLWIPGNTAYVDRSVGSKYGASALRIVRTKGGMKDRLGAVLQEGGRLSLGLMREHAAQIDAEFGEGVAARITLKETLEVGNGCR